MKADNSSFCFISRQHKIINNNTKFKIIITTRLTTIFFQSTGVFCNYVSEELVGGTELENCFEYSVHFLRSFSSDTYQEGSSEWRA